MNIKEELDNRKLPPILCMEDGTPVHNEEQWNARKEEIAQILQHNFCGFVPPLRPQVEGRIMAEDTRTAFAGKAIYQNIDICCSMAMGSFTFPCHFVRPKKVEKAPVFVYISFSQSLVDELIPVEEILDNGFAVASFCYQDIAPDTDDDFKNGVATAYGRNPYDSWGKVRMWAWAASRVVDYLITLECIDVNRIAVVGHSRLGKAALQAGAFDERFSLTISNDSGGAGAAVFRGKTGEKVKHFRGGVSGHWFVGNFKQYIRREDELPFDMHFLLSMIAPRNLYVCSAKEDSHADPASEFLCCVASSEVYEKIYDKKGLVTQAVDSQTEMTSIPEDAVVMHKGDIGYHMREGTHFLSRYDWQQFMDYRNMPEHMC